MNKIEDKTKSETELAGYPDCHVTEKEKELGSLSLSYMEFWNPEEFHLALFLSLDPYIALLPIMEQTSSPFLYFRNISMSFKVILTVNFYHYIFQTS